MKRELDTEEVKKSLKGIERIENELKDLKETINYNKKTIDFQKIQDEYQDFIRPYVKKKKDIENKKAMDYLNQDLKSKMSIVNNLKEQIEKGVEIK